MVMAKKKEQLYYHQDTGDICYATKSQAKKLGDRWQLVEFVENEKGERVMRFVYVDELGNRATIDVSPNGEKEVTTDVNGNTK